MLIATAGHVDHGKSTLVKALTGVDTDRLPEEKRRGLTIEPGFSFLSLPANGVPLSEKVTLGFIDLPGHEKFIRNMAAGVGAIDVALLVVAADDGIMPQTREHVAILDLMGISKCVVAVTRVDLVDESCVDVVRKEVDQLLEPTSLKDAITLPVCAPRNKGIAELTERLLYLTTRTSLASVEGHFRLAIDRVFTVHGAGTVVTGSVFSGSVKEGDVVSLLPSKKAARVRGIRVNGEQAVSAKRGQRTALNLANIEKNDVDKGDWVTASAQTVLSSCVDVQMRLLNTEPRPLKHWTPAHIHAGAASTMGRIALYGDRSVEPGGVAWAQLVLEQPMHLLFQDRFILRDQGASRTMGGGIVVDPFASRQKSFRKNRTTVIKGLMQHDHPLALINALEASPAGLLENTFKHGRNLTKKHFSALINEVGAVSCMDSKGEGRLFRQSQIDQATKTILRLVNQFHVTIPEQVGIETRVLNIESDLPPLLLTTATAQLLEQGHLLRRGIRLKNPNHRPTLNDADKSLLYRLHNLARPDSMQPPPLSELVKNLELEQTVLLEKLQQFSQLGHIVQVAKNRFYHPIALERLFEIAQKLSRESNPAGFEAKSFRDQAGIGRNLTIDLLEYFDHAGLTRRINDRRITRP